MSNFREIRYEITCGGCPNQVEGTIDGYPFYFRGRHGHWTFCVSKVGTDPVGPGTENVIHLDQASVEDAGWWDNSETEKVLMECVSRYFRREKHPETEYIDPYDKGMEIGK